MTPARAALLAVVAVIGAALWWRRNPSACPYSQRFWVEAPHPFITRARLAEALGPRPGERILEIGPGTGYYTLDVAEAVGPDGRLDILDVQQEMLDHTMGRVREIGLENVEPALADARDLPYADATFDGAFLVTVLGEVPDPGRALAELARVVSVDGRIVVGELVGDPHVVLPRRLRELAAAAGLRAERSVGPWIGRFTVLRHAGGNRPR